MGHKKKRNRRIPSTGKQLPSYNQIHTRMKYQKQRLHSWTRKVQRCQIQQGFYPGRLNTLQAYRNIPIHEFVFVSPTRCHKRLYQRRSFKASKNNSSEITFEENMRNFSTRLKNRDYPATTVEKHLSEVIFEDRKKVLEQSNENVSKKILPFLRDTTLRCSTSRTYS